MAKRRTKKRTHKALTDEERAQIPKSMVFRMTDSKRHVTKNLSQMVRDFRQIMEPHTAAKLRERKSNKLKDFVVMAGPLAVSHMFVFSNSSALNMTLRVARVPRGPTLHFNVKSYSLCKDISNAQKSPRSVTPDMLLTPPLLVMNNFKNNSQKESSKEALLTSMFQNIFPAINVATTKLSQHKRVVMLNKDPETGEIELRHYAIITKDVDQSKAIKKLSTIKKKLQKGVPNLSRAGDIADFVTDPHSVGAYTSESEIEDDATVEITERKRQKLNEKAARSTTAETETSTENVAEQQQHIITSTQRKAIKLVEIGPRLQLELRKIDEGLFEGKTLYHAYIEKNEEEEKAMEKEHQKKLQIKAERRERQLENVRKKKEAQEAKMSRTKRGILKAKQLEDVEKLAQQADDDDDDSKDDGSEPGEQDDEEGLFSEEEMDDYDLELAEIQAQNEDDEDEESD